MGFLKWLYEQYRNYKTEQELTVMEPNEEQKMNSFINNYNACVEAGFSREQIAALMNLMAHTE